MLARSESLFTPGATWQENREVDVCNGRLCQRRFVRVFCPRHHCRWCGRIFCDACAPRTATCSGGSSTFYRRCNSCRLPAIFGHVRNPFTGQMDCTAATLVMSFLSPASVTALLQSCHTMLAHCPLDGCPLFPSIQSRFPSFHPGALIGCGGFGSVYKCEDRRTHDQRQVILKCITKASNRTYTMWQRAFTELKVLRAAKHQNVARLLEVFQTKEHLIVVLEAGDGGTAKEASQYMRKYRLQLEPLVAAVVEGVAAGLEYLYTNLGVVHRDIKMDNIVLNANYTTPMIIDFGLAEYVTSEAKTYVAAGTPGYAAPESVQAVVDATYQFSATGEVMHRGDLFSLGVVAYSMLTAHHPFRSRKTRKQWGEMKAGIRCQGPLWDGISEEARHLVELLLSYDPFARPTYTEIVANPFIALRTEKLQHISDYRMTALRVEEDKVQAEWVMLNPSEMLEGEFDALPLQNQHTTFRFFCRPSGP